MAILTLAACRKAPAQVADESPVPDARPLTAVPSVGMPAGSDASSRIEADGVVAEAGVVVDGGAARDAGSPNAGVWHAALAIPGGSPADVHLIWSDERWRWRASSHRGCQSGIIERFGRWRVLDGAVTLDEQLRIVRVVTEPGRYAAYRACAGYWDGRTCDPKQPAGVVAECPLAGTTERVEEPPRSRAAALTVGPCVRGKTRTSVGVYSGADEKQERMAGGHRCLSIGGHAHWSFGSENDIADFVPERTDVVFDAAAGVWHRAAASPP